MDGPEHPEHPAPATDESYLTVVDVAKALQVDRRTVLRYILDGIAGPDGSRIRLEAQLLTTPGGQEYQIRRSNLDTFTRMKGMPARERTSSVKGSGAQLIAIELELERLHSSLRQAYDLIKTQSEEIAELASRAGQYEGENRALREQLRRAQRGFIARLFSFFFGEDLLHIAPPTQSKTTEKDAQ